MELFYNDDAAHVEFLPQLPSLTALELFCHNEEQWHVPADALLASLVLCNGLTTLSLDCGFSSAQWTALFANLTKLRTLEIRQGLDSLRCFASGPITQSLEQLTIRYLELTLPPSELLYLYALRRIRSLHLDRCFSTKDCPPPTEPIRWEQKRISKMRNGCSMDVRLQAVQAETFV